MRYSETDDNRIENIITAYGDLLYRTGIMILGNPQDVQDVLQEVMLKVLQKKPEFHDSEHEKAWLLRVTINLCKDMLRFRRRHQYLPLDELEIEAAADTADKELIQEIMLLPPRWKIVLLLHYVEGYSLKEIADILAISENAVKKRMQRAKKGLRERLNG
ncbi:MAG: sigma-70 family RNA polymerase sigma factor [Bacillus sp. (in: Bacteria)]|nr:sigma-70 family RNA polymerase sigma factor [Bacillus sp. (in: firmicutes)]MCM1427888.1 sigma-70 family RNA polymerase sigma factor [Eubacterium sp.]